MPGSYNTGMELALTQTQHRPGNPLVQKGRPA